MAKHARLSASGAHRWLHCRASPSRIEALGDGDTASSTAAMLGTSVHFLIAQCLLYNLDPRNMKGRFIAVHPNDEVDTDWVHAKNENRLRKAGCNLFLVGDKEIVGAELFLELVAKIKAEAEAPGEVYIEKSLEKLTELHPDLGGSLDFGHVVPFGWADVADYKNGNGVVEVTDNEQLKKYGLGILLDHPDIEGVRTWIVQPNCPHDDGLTRMQAYTAEELYAFRDEIIAAALEVNRPNAEVRPGHWCDWCPVKDVPGRCKEHDEWLQEGANLDFDDEPGEIPVADPAIGDEEGILELERRAQWIPYLDKYARAIKGRLQREAAAGKQLRLHKLVRGKPGNRKWVDEEQAKAVLVEAGWPEDALTETKLLSASKIEKAVRAGKRKLRELEAEREEQELPPLTTRSEGKLALVPIEAPGEPVDPSEAAADDFDDDPDGTGDGE